VCIVAITINVSFVPVRLFLIELQASTLQRSDIPYDEHALVGQLIL
jgi:hypothetical protein